MAREEKRLVETRDSDFLRRNDKIAMTCADLGSTMIVLLPCQVGARRSISDDKLLGVIVIPVLGFIECRLGNNSRRRSWTRIRA